MKTKQKHNGSVLLITLFVIAFLSMLVMGMAQINTEEVQLMRNQIYAAHALTVAQAGLNDAFSEIRADSSWTSGFAHRNFNGGWYNVTVSGDTITSTGTSAQNYVARIQADITTGNTSPYRIRIDSLRINE